MTPAPLPPTPDPATCSAFRRAARQSLDGPGVAEVPDPAHAAACLDCRRYAAAVRVLASGLVELGRGPTPVPTAGFADRVVRAALRERRVRTLRRPGAGLAMAAGVLVAVALLRPRGGNDPAPVAPSAPDFAQAPIPITPEPVRVEEKLSEAGSALAALTRRTAGEAVGPTRDLFASFATPTFPTTVAVPPDAEPVVEALAEIPQAAQAGVEPVTNSARRAVALFLRDTGLSPPTAH